jgi:hypothetical protein
MAVDHVIDSLMALLSVRPPPPRWLASACGRYLSQAILRPGGVFVVFDRMLRTSSARERGDAAIATAAKHIATVPVSVSRNEYFSAVLSQLAKIL